MGMPCLKPNENTCTSMSCSAVSSENAACRRLRSAAVRMRLVSMTMSARSRMLASAMRSRWMASAVVSPRVASGCLRRFSL